MPAYTRNRKKNQTIFVAVTPQMMYGFAAFDIAAASGVSSADLLNDLGHQTAEQAAGASNQIKVIGANSPKPPRVTKQIANAGTNQQGSVSTFCAYNKLVSARRRDWRLSSRNRSVSLKPSSANKKSCTAIAKLSNNALYAFPMNTADFNFSRGPLGLLDASQISTTERQRLVMGSTTPKPGTASIEVAGGKLSTFFSSENADSASQAGWNIDTEELL